MIHKIHDGGAPALGAGRGTDPVARATTRRPRSRTIAGSSATSSLREFPVLPNAWFRAARLGYSALTTASRRSMTRSARARRCARRCHGDRRRRGPLAGARPGSIAFSQPSRQRVRRCHDDIDFTKPYKRNSRRCRPRLDDSDCMVCHPPRARGRRPPAVAHVHPMNDPNFNPGFKVAVTAVHEAGTNNTTASSTRARRSPSPST